MHTYKIYNFMPLDVKLNYRCHICQKIHWFICMSLNLLFFTFFFFLMKISSSKDWKWYFIICLVWFLESISSVGECCVTNDCIHLLVLSGFYCDEIRKLIYNLPHVHHFTYDFCFKIKRKQFLNTKHMIQWCLCTPVWKSC